MDTCIFVSDSGVILILIIVRLKSKHILYFFLNTISTYLHHKCALGFGILNGTIVVQSWCAYLEIFTHQEIAKVCNAPANNPSLAIVLLYILLVGKCLLTFYSLDLTLNRLLYLQNSKINFNRLLAMAVKFLIL